MKIKLLEKENKKSFIFLFIFLPSICVLARAIVRALLRRKPKLKKKCKIIIKISLIYNERKKKEFQLF
jgi:hypothetical protein